jgi:hypothetical protein
VTAFTSPAFAAVSVFLVISTLAVTIGAMYIGGGTAAVRRQVPALGLLTALLIAGAFGIPLLVRALGDLAVGVLILALNVALLIARRRQARRGQGPSADARRAAWRNPAFRKLMAVWISSLFVATVLLVIATRSGY